MFRNFVLAFIISILMIGCAPQYSPYDYTPEIIILKTGEEVYSVEHILANSIYYNESSVLVDGYINYKSVSGILINDGIGNLYNLENGLFCMSVMPKLAKQLQISPLSHIPKLEVGNKYRFKLIIYYLKENGKTTAVIIEKPELLENN